MVVEFSETGNACYIYDYNKYKEEKIDSVLYSTMSRENATVDKFFNDNMQSLKYMNISDDYLDREDPEIVYFKDTTYAQAYALCSMDDDHNVVVSNEDYSLVRFIYFDENLEEQYIYIKLV